MARKSIFTILSESFDIESEILKLEDIISKKQIYYCDNPFGEENHDTIIALVDRYYHTWNGRKTTISVEDLRKTLMISDILTSIDIGLGLTEDEIITYLEYASNLLFLLKKFYSDKYLNGKYLTIAEDNLHMLIEKLNLKSLYIEEHDGIILVQSNPLATKVAESLPQNFGILILRYHHNLLKGNLIEKSSILVAMAKEYETFKKELESTTYKPLATDIGICLNNLKIRHSNHNNIANSMTVEEIEDWYDYTYDLLLTGFSLHNYLQTRDRIEKLKQTL